MSAKYRRIKQADEALPAPLRWLTRAFSSITLAVVLLCLVALYGVLGSLPFYYAMIGGAWIVSAAVALGFAGWAGVRVGPRKLGLDGPRKLAFAIGSMLLGVGATAGLWTASYRWVDGLAMFAEHRATKVYRLPAVEMNETEFFSWWPMQLILLLFVCNMVWATIRRIEFKFVNLGVLTVHTGIVMIGLGSVFYGQLKLEGDMFIVRSDLPGGQPVGHFYDRITPALFVSYNHTPAVQFTLPELPRFNDYAMGELDIALHERPDFAEKFGEHVRITIPGFIAYGEFESTWVEAPADVAEQFSTDGLAVPQAGVGPAVVLAHGDVDRAHDQAPRTTLPAVRPADRVVETDAWAVEYLHEPDPQRLADLSAAAPPGAAHALLVEVPEADYREVHAIFPGAQIALGDTGYSLTVEEIGSYSLPFVTDGYRGATDTQATLLINRPGPTKPVRRIALHRYPERTQDFVDGQRGDPDPAIRTVYLDQSKIQVHLVTGHARAGLDVGDVVPIAEGMWVLLRVAGIQPVFSPLAEGKLPVAEPDKTRAWLHVVDRFEQALPAQLPVPTPRALRDPKIEGTYEMALVPVQVEVDRVDEHHRPTGETFRRTVWLRQMPYLEQQGGEMRPRTVDVPGFGQLEFSFSRERHALPFAVAMTDFEMTPYAGSSIPRDFQSDLLVYPVDRNGRPDGAPERFSPRMNHPAIVRVADAPLPLRKIKLSQAGWDPGDPDTAASQLQLRDDQGRLVNQQRFTILGVGNNVAIHVIALGGVLMALGIPWAFYVKPWLVKRKARKFNQSLQTPSSPPESPGGPQDNAADLPKSKPAPERRPELVSAAD
ncbi:MAG: hypothetical protein AAFX76_08255 [Planctomycetota bacterium]